MPRTAYGECRQGPLPDTAGMAIVASTDGVTYVVAEDEGIADGSWRSLVLARADDPAQRITIRPVSDAPHIVCLTVPDGAPCGPLAFHLVMETHGRTLDGPPAS
jgi:hypothetical protein